MNNSYSLRGLAKISGIPAMTLQHYKERGIITPDVADAKGNLTLYSDVQLEKAKAYRAATPPKTKKKAATDDSNLFTGLAAAPAADVPVVEETANETDGSEVADDTAANVPSPVVTADKDFLPMTITPNFDAIPQAMKDLRRWLCWQLRLKDKPKKPNEKTKIPMTPKNGRLVFADVTKPENWLTFDEAISYY